MGLALFEHAPDVQELVESGKGLLGRISGEDLREFLARDRQFGDDLGELGDALLDEGADIRGDDF